jgi:hypothetical protein
LKIRALAVKGLCKWPTESSLGWDVLFVVFWQQGADMLCDLAQPRWWWESFWPRLGGTEGEYTDEMDYSVGSRVRVRLYSGKVVEAEITAITNQSTGRKLQIVYGNVTASINPAQITEVLPAT